MNRLESTMPTDLSPVDDGLDSGIGDERERQEDAPSSLTSVSDDGQVRQTAAGIGRDCCEERLVSPKLLPSAER